MVNEKKTLIELIDIKKEYHSEGVVTKVLHGVNLKINKGEYIAIVGRSGSGKSTLMNIIGFLDRPTSGVYNFKDKDVSELEDDQLAEMRNSEIGFIFQTFNLLPRTSVIDNIKLPLIYSKKKKDKIKLAKQAAKAVGLEHRLNYMSNQLSGGEKQRVAIARALVNEPSVILADEPTGNLDSKTGQKIMEAIQDLYEKGNTIIMVTHEKYTAEYAERIVTLKDGLILKDDKNHRRRNAKVEVLQK